jgi:hypothetical protein
VSVLTKLWAGRSGTRVSAGAKFIYFFQPVQCGSVSHLTYSIGTGVSFPEYNGWGVKLTTHLSPVPRFELNRVGPVSLHSLYALMMLGDRTLFLYM